MNVFPYLHELLEYLACKIDDVSEGEPSSFAPFVEWFLVTVDALDTAALPPLRSLLQLVVPDQNLVLYQVFAV